MTSLRHLGLVVAALVACACGDAEAGIRWQLQFEPSELEDRALFVEATVLEGGCDGTKIAARYRIGDGTTTPDEPIALTRGERFGFRARARDGDCTWFAQGCEERSWPPESGEIVVRMEDDPGPPACPPHVCRDGGRCDESAVVEVVAGRAHSCAVTYGGQMWCWGKNAEGQLGDGTTTERLTAVRVRELSDAATATAGGVVADRKGHTCAVQRNERVAGDVYCWGYNAQGQLGDGTRTDRSEPTQAESLDQALTLSAGGRHTCAVRRGAVWCWGDNEHGQLGNGTTETRLTAVEAGNFDLVTQVAAGHDHTCVRNNTFRIDCWGANGSGQLGRGTIDDEPHPQRQAILRGDFIDLSAGREHNCAVRDAGEVLCWGAGGAGQLGNGSTDDQPEPVEVVGLDDAVQVAAGGSQTCARRRNGHLACWGMNYTGMLGQGTQDDERHTEPEPVPGIDDAIDIAMGLGHTCVLRSSGEVWCWGSGEHGRNGSGTREHQPTPAPVIGIGE